MESITRRAQEPGKEPKPPQIQERAKFLEEDQRRWVEHDVEPYLRHLLNKLQKRLKRPIYLETGVFDRLQLQAKPGSKKYDANYRKKLEWLSESVGEDVAYGNRLEEYRGELSKRFPELYEIFVVLQDLNDSFDGWTTDDIYPTVKPWRKPKRQKSISLPPLSLSLPLPALVVSFPSRSGLGRITADRSSETMPLPVAG